MTAGRKGSWSGGGESDGELLVVTADRLRWRAPELALEFARQAATRAGADQDKLLVLRANALVVAALVRLGKHADAVEPAVLALREAESAGERDLAGSVRVDLAASTRAIGLAGSAFVLVRPMLEGSDARPGLRAGALAEIVAGLAQAGRREVIDEVLSEADRLYAADESVDPDVRRLLRALLCARMASFRRRWGNPTGAVAAATEGMALLDGLADPATDSGQARAELGLEMVSALLDAGEDDAAIGQAEQTLADPIRATSATAAGRLMLILATRVYMPAGRVQEAFAMLAEIVRVARRHGLDGLLADVLTSLAHAQEADGELTEALDSLRSARAAEQRRLRSDTMARLIILDELGAGTRLPDDTESLLRRVVRTPVRSFLDTAGRGAGMEAASREMSGRELGGEDIGRRRRNRAASETTGSMEPATSVPGSEDVLGRELAGWEMVARERAAREAKTSRAASELIAADRATADWPTTDWSGDHPSSDWSESLYEATLQSVGQYADTEPASEDVTESEQATTGRSRSRRHSAEPSDSDWPASAAPGSSTGGRRRAPAEWSAAERVAADRAVSGQALGDDGKPAEPTEPTEAAASAGGQPQWPDQRVVEERDEQTGLLNRQGLRRRLAAARRQARPTALTLVRLEPDPEPEPRATGHPADPDSTDRFSAALIKAIDQAGKMPDFDPDVLSSLAGYVRDMAPEDAELVHPTEGELAVLLPDTTRDEAEQFAATLRETVSTSVWDPDAPSRDVSVSTGVAQYQDGTTEDALLSAAREALTAAEPENEPVTPDWQSVEPVYDLPPDDSGYSYVAEEYAQLSYDGPEPVDEEMAEYLAGFPLPDYSQWPQATTETPDTGEEPDMPPRHDGAAPAEPGGRSVLDRLDITRGSGGRRRARDGHVADQSADYLQYPAEPDYGGTGDEVLAAAEEASARASIPHVPDPEEVPVPPDSPEVPVPPDPDADPKPGRRRMPEPEQDPARPGYPDIDPRHPAEPGPRPGRRRVPEEPDPQPGRRGVPHHPDIDPQPDPLFPPEPEPEPRPGRRRSGTFPEPDPGTPGLPTHPDTDPQPDPDSRPSRRILPGNPDIDPPASRTARPVDPAPGDGDGDQGLPSFPGFDVLAVADLLDAATRPGRRRAPETQEPNPTGDSLGLPGVASEPTPSGSGARSGRRRVPESQQPDSTDADAGSGRGGSPPFPSADGDPMPSGAGVTPDRLVPEHEEPDPAGTGPGPDVAESGSGRSSALAGLDGDLTPFGASSRPGRRRAPEGQDPDSPGVDAGSGAGGPSRDSLPPFSALDAELAAFGSGAREKRRRAPEEPVPDVSDSATASGDRSSDAASGNAAAEPEASSEAGGLAASLGVDAVSGADLPRRPNRRRALDETAPSGSEAKPGRSGPPNFPGIDGQLVAEVLFGARAGRRRAVENAAAQSRTQQPEPEAGPPEERAEPPAGPDERTGGLAAILGVDVAEPANSPAAPPENVAWPGGKAATESSPDTPAADAAASERRAFPYEQEDSVRLPGRRRRPEPESPDPTDAPGGRRRKPEQPTDSYRTLPEPADMRSGSAFAPAAESGRRRAPEPQEPPAAVEPPPEPQPDPSTLSALAELTEIRPRPNPEPPQPNPRPRAQEEPADRWDNGPTDIRPRPQLPPEQPPAAEAGQQRPEKSANRWDNGPTAVRPRPQLSPDPQPASPAADNPATANPAAKNPVTEKPGADQPAADKPATDKPAAEKPVVEKPAARWDDGPTQLRPRPDLQQPEPGPGEPETGLLGPRPGSEPPAEPRKRRLTSVQDTDAAVPAESTDPADPSIGSADSPQSVGRPSRLRRRERTDLKLADLLAEALVAYQSSTAETPDEDVLSAYDDTAGRVVREHPRTERETGY